MRKSRIEIRRADEELFCATVPAEKGLFALGDSADEAKRKLETILNRKEATELSGDLARKESRDGG